jgi:hypothetical protein
METAAAALMDQAGAALEPVIRLAVRAQSEDLEACRPHLERAVRLLEAALAAIGNGGARDGNSRRALERFCLELKKASMLHEHAGAFYGGWMRILANGLEAGYSPQGAGAWRFEAGRRVSLEA